MMDAWTALRQSRLFRKLTTGGGGFCRQVEVTWSPANGFHPHLHVLVWSKLDLRADSDWGPSEVDEMEHDLWREWSAQMAKAGRNVSEEHGITLIRADDPAMGRYLAKVGLELTMGALKTGRHASWSMWDIAATAMDPDVSDEVRARCRALWAEYTSVVGGRRMFETSRGLLKRAEVEELDEQAEAERQHGEFVPYVAADAPVYSAADKAGVVPELKGLLASRTAPGVLALVLSRRLGRAVVVEAPNDDVPLPLLRWNTSMRGRRLSPVCVMMPTRDATAPPKLGLKGKPSARGAGDYGERRRVSPRQVVLPRRPVNSARMSPRARMRVIDSDGRVVEATSFLEILGNSPPA